MAEGAAPPSYEPLEGALTGADDRLRLNRWLPPQDGIVPRVHIGKRWVNVLWAVPIGVTALIVLIAIAQSLRELPGVKAFIKQYPGIAQAAPSVDSGFPCRALDRDPICVAQLPCRSQLDPLQRPATVQLFRHRFHCGAAVDPHRAHAKSGHLEQAGLVRPGFQSPGDAVGPLPFVRLVRVVHPDARASWCSSPVSGKTPTTCSAASTTRPGPGFRYSSSPWR